MPQGGVAGGGVLPAVRDAIATGAELCAAGCASVCPNDSAAHRDGNSADECAACGGSASASVDSSNEASEEKKRGRLRDLGVCGDRDIHQPDRQHDVASHVVPPNLHSAAAVQSATAGDSALPADATRAAAGNMAIYATASDDARLTENGSICPIATRDELALGWNRHDQSHARSAPLSGSKSARIPVSPQLRSHRSLNDLICSIASGRMTIPRRQERRCAMAASTFTERPASSRYAATIAAERE